jgi:hypothetical protein
MFFGFSASAHSDTVVENKSFNIAGIQGTTQIIKGDFYADTQVSALGIAGVPKKEDITNAGSYQFPLVYDTPGSKT